MAVTLSVITPTLHRPDEIAGILENLNQQSCLPAEVILVDGAPEGEDATENIVSQMSSGVSFPVRHIRHGGGTAIQRNVGIDAAVGNFVALIDDDIRLEADFFEYILLAFENDTSREVGGITGYITNQFLDPETSPRWRWYRRMRLFTTYEPGRYDFQTGSPINRYLQPPHETLREIDFMGAGCVVWRREVFENGLRFSHFFTGYGVLEDAHFALRAGKTWRLLEHGRAHCIHIHSPIGRINRRQRARVAAVNHRFVFVDIVPDRTWYQEFRFWRLQFFDLFRFTIHALRHPNLNSWMTVLGKIEGIFQAFGIRPEFTVNTSSL